MVTPRAARGGEGAIGMALHLVKRFGPLTALVREERWGERGAMPVGDLDGASLGVIGYGRIGRRPRSSRRPSACESWPRPGQRAPGDIRCADSGLAHERVSLALR